MNLQKTIVFTTLFLDIVGIAIIIPAFPELKAYYGITDFQVTMGLTIYSLFSFLAAPLLGQWSDKFWRKKPLVLCIIGTMFSYLILLVTQQYWIFLLSRLVNGITGGNISILQAILTDISPDKETKAKNFGIMGALFGMWFIVGPVVGSLLLKFGGIETIFWFGALFALIEVVLITVHFSNTNEADPQKVLSYNSFNVMRKYFRKPDMRNFLISMFLLGVGGFMINATQSLYMNNLFGTSGEEYGYYLALVGIITALNLGFLVPRFWTKMFSNKQLIIMSHIVLIIGYMLVGYASSLYGFLGLFYATILLSGYYVTVYNVNIMSKALPHETGELSGMLAGTQSLLMFVGPLLGGLILAIKYNVYYGAAIFAAISFAVMMRYITKKTDTI
jgi:DHA1 family tetracycline resistance protein-like MFS transporter